jgi:hypothetical protein
VNSCIQGGTAPCQTGLVCANAFPNGACVCPAPPANCPTTGNFCLGTTTLVACTQSTQGCLQEADTSCTGMGLVCGAVGGTASCVCPAPPSGCAGGAGTKSCAGDTTLLTCSADSHSCVVGQTTTCQSGQYCWTSTNACAPPTAVGYPTDFGASGAKTGGYLLGQTVTITATSKIRSFGLLTPSAGSMVSMGLYTNVNNLPSQLVAKVEFQAVVVGVPAKNEYPASPAMTGGSLQIAPGTYWLMALFDVSTSTEIAPTSGPTTTVAFVMTGWGSALPQTLGSVSTQANQRATNYYMLVTQ